MDSTQKKVWTFEEDGSSYTVVLCDEHSRHMAEAPGLTSTEAQPEAQCEVCRRRSLRRGR